MSSADRHMVMATAGHIDHGKTALVRALTGMETDRLEEEKRRGITIELGFAFLGDRITIIDVPGHERFIKTMVAGVTTVDLGFLVIAADDGIMPQTREHLAILDLLGIPSLFVVLTKIEGVDADWLALVEDETRDLLPPVYQSSARFFRCDSLSGQGILELKKALLDFSGQLPPRYDSGVFRLPVDRAFALKGHGTVVTGTILGGTVNVGDRLQVMPPGLEVRVRGLQSHGHQQQSQSVGQRAALNLSGSDLGRIRRGDWICEKDAFLSTDVLDIRLITLQDAPALKNRDRIRFHVGTSEAIGRLMLFGCDVLSPEGNAFGQIILEKRIMATRDDRFVIRRYSPLQTLGGGRVLDPLPERRRRSDPGTLTSFDALEKASGLDALEHKIKSAEASGLTGAVASTFMNVPRDKLKNLVRSLQDQGAVFQIGTLECGRMISAENFDKIKMEILQRIDVFHRRFPQLLGMKPASLISELSSDFPVQMAEQALDELVKSGDLSLDRGHLRKPGHVMEIDPEQEALYGKIEDLLEASGFNPPGVEIIRKRLGLSEAELNRALEVMNQQGRVARLGDGSPWTAGKVQEAWKLLKPQLSRDRGKTISELREALGCPRRFAVTLAEYFDRIGLTERQEDLRLPGPKYNSEI